MSLAALYNIPRSPQALEEFLIANEAHHYQIAADVKAKKGITIQPLPIRPLFRNDMSGWLARHQLWHDATNSAFGLGNNDLLVLDFDNADQLANFSWLHFTEHQTWDNMVSRL